MRYPFIIKLGKSTDPRLEYRRDIIGGDRGLWIEEGPKNSTPFPKFYLLHVLHIDMTLLTRKPERYQSGHRNPCLSFKKV